MIMCHGYTSIVDMYSVEGMAWNHDIFTLATKTSETMTLVKETLLVCNVLLSQLTFVHLDIIKAKAEA